MAPLKRKAVTEEGPSKKAKAGDVKETSGRGREHGKEKKPQKSRKPQEAAAAGEQKKTAVKSVLQQEERAFPRGGASLLTPLEHKQIRNQAERDILLELEDGQKTGSAGDDGDELFNETASALTKRTRKTGRKNADGVPKVEGSGVRIDGLSYKSLVVGSTVLGRVTAITAKDVALALPNNLTGYVPITAISESLNARIERMLTDDTKSGPDEGIENDDDEDIDLEHQLYVGQWLRAAVTSTGTDPAEGKSRKHIELSVEPAVVNGGQPEDNLVEHGTLQASVRSVEDHGIVMDLGLADCTVKGFISKKELGSAYSLDKLQVGQVMLCLVTGKGSNGKVLKLSPDTAKMSAASSVNKPPVVTSAPTVDAFLPGTVVEILIIESGPRGVVGKVMGMMDVTADLLHSAAIAVEDMDKKYKIGSKTKARIIFAIPQDDGSRRIGVSFLDHVLALLPPPSKLPGVATSKLKSQAAELDQLLALSSTIGEAKVVQILSDKGLYLRFPFKAGREDHTIVAFAHISQISDKRIDAIPSKTGPYQIETTHKARILSYSPVDNVYYVALKQSILDQAFLRLEDLTVGEIVNGTVDKLILGGPKGFTGLLVKLSDSMTGLVPEMHISDAQLKHPERKFKEGLPVHARILSVDLQKRHIRLTLKKSLVDSHDSSSIWKDYKELKPGMETQGTIINLLPNGAVVQFYGAVRAWLPVAEMSETYIEKPDKHFWLGQSVRVKVVSVDPEAHEMKVSCKDNSTFTADQTKAWQGIVGGKLVTGTVVEKTADSITLDLDNGLKGLIRIGHLVDASSLKAESALKRIRVGQSLKNLLVLIKQERSRTVLLSNKPALIEDAKSGKLIDSGKGVSKGDKVHGFVRNITPDAVYVEFANGVVGLLPKSQILPEMLAQPNFGLRKDQTLRAWIFDVDVEAERFVLTLRERIAGQGHIADSNLSTNEGVSNAVDATVRSMSDFKLGKVTQARIASVKATQLNVRLADNVQGRVDVSEVFDSWEEITDKAAPLQKFKQNDIIDVKLLGIHDARNHRFLPISHRQGKLPVFELSAKKSRVESGDGSLLSLESVKTGSSYLAFINNHSDSCVWVNLSPNVRGRIALLDLSDDVGQLQNVENRFRIGCALKVQVKAVDVSAGRLDLTARPNEASTPLTFKDLSPGMVLAARVIKSSERAVSVAIASNLVCHVPLVELGDDYEEANPAQYAQHDIVRVCVVDVDAPNKRAFVSLRPSKVLSSSLPVKDPQILSVSQLKAGDIVRGFVKKVAEKGVFVSLGAHVDALVRIADLSDQFVKDWRSIYEVDQLVKGCVMAVDNDSKQVQMSLKKAHVDGSYKPPLTINELEEGMTVTGKIRKVEDFGAFIDIDNTQPRLSGLCHRSEIASRRVEDVRELYSAGDIVKAKILNVDVEGRKISLGLKASYFNNESVDEIEDEDGEEEDVDVDGGVTVGEDASDGNDSDEMAVAEVQDMESDVEDAEADSMEMEIADALTSTGGLKTSGFEWSGNDVDADARKAAYESEPDSAPTKKRKRNKAEIKEDLTGDLDRHGPRSTSDFERRLLGQPNNSSLWIQYMAFQLELSEIQKARDIAERALRTIHIREQDEKTNVWIAWLNLEVVYGDEGQVEEVFKQACQVTEPLEMHEKLASIYIASGKHDKADSIYERIVGNKTFRANKDIWYNYASFLMDILHRPDRARALLSRALQSVPTHEHRTLTSKFAALEFHSPQGDVERGRTIFEGLVSEWPRWTAGWDMWTDLERSRIARVETGEAKTEARDKTRALFERLAEQKMKKRRAKNVFKRWLDFEQKEGSEKLAQRVQELAREYVQKMQEQGGEDEEGGSG